MIPKVGQMMNFYPFPKGTHPGPQAAIVAFVWEDDGVVNLATFDPHGSPQAVTSIPWVKKGDNPPEKSSYCEFQEAPDAGAKPAQTVGTPSPAPVTPGGSAGPTPKPAAPAASVQSKPPAPAPVTKA